MLLSEFKNKLENIENITFCLEDGIVVPDHFHITEIGHLNKSFIDCGGVHRVEDLINFQLWFAADVEHKLTPKKLNYILEEAIDVLNLDDKEIEVEYQGDTIGKFALTFDKGSFILKNKFTNCLAEDQCGVSAPKKKVELSSVGDNSCAPGSGCC